MKKLQKPAYKVVAIKISELGRPERRRLWFDTCEEAMRMKAHAISLGYHAAVFTRASAHSQLMEQVVR